MQWSLMRAEKLRTRNSLHCFCVMLAALSALTILTTLSASSQAISASPTVRVPAPTGPDRVWTLTMRVVDTQRNDPYLRDGTKRELAVRFWYPTPSDAPCRPAEYASPEVWAYLTKLLSIQLPEIQTNSCWNAPVANGAHPIILMTHSYTGMLTDYTFISEDLASRGYVVASIAHTYETTVVEFPDGRLEDLKFLVGKLATLNLTPQSPFFVRLDLSRIGVVGHSLGGEATLSSLEQDARLKAAVILDGVVSDESAEGTNKAVPMNASNREKWNEDEHELWSHLRGFRLVINLLGADHRTPSDGVWLTSFVPTLAVSPGMMGSQKTIAVIRNYIAAFFDLNLLSKSQSFPLGGPAETQPQRS